MLVILAHGALGAWDEILLAVVALLFLVVILLVALRSRGFTPEYEDDAEGGQSTTGDG